jgi:hypothetical protein
MRRTFILINNDIRRNCWEYIKTCPDDYKVVISPSTRSDAQSSMFHAICGNLEKSKFQWAGKPRTLEQWKVLLISGLAVATKDGAEVVPGIEQEYVNIRESTSSMTTSRMAMLIEYSIAFCAQNGIKNEYM